MVLRSGSLFVTVLGLCFLATAGTSLGASETVLYSFCTQPNCVDGASPYAGLIDVNGTLYGTTESGGVSNCFLGYGCGTVYSLDPQSGTETVLHKFSHTDGAYPFGGLVNVRGKLYGTTEEGGANGCFEDYYGCGTIFSLDLTSGTDETVYSFCSQKYCADGEYPSAGVIERHGALYGSTANGGDKGCSHYGCGTVFSFDVTTGDERVLHAFICGKRICPDGADSGSLVDVGGVLYGTTLDGGSGTHCPHHESVCGTVFSVDSETGAKTVVYSFCNKPACKDGFWPATGVIDVDGIIYGTTAGGGTYGGGTVYALDPNSGVETVLYSFCGQSNCPDGEEPDGLIEVKGKFYGTTGGGGTGTENCPFSNGCGTVFVLNPKNGVEKVLHSFCSQNNCADGADPVPNLIDVKGTLYGVTYAGGASTNCTTTGGCGTVFSITQ